jgi:hypothetical protein
VVLLADNTVRSVAEQVATAGVLLLCLLVVSRVFGLVLANIAITGIIASIKASFGLA